MVTSQELGPPHPDWPSLCSKGRVDCKGSVFRQLASRWANDSPAGQLSRSQGVWLWDIPEVLVWTAWNPQGKRRPPTPSVSPTVPLTRASTAGLPHQTQVQICLCLLAVCRTELRSQNVTILQVLKNMYHHWPLIYFLFWQCSTTNSSPWKLITMRSVD